MPSSVLLKWVGGLVVALVTLTVLRFKPWDGADGSAAGGARQKVTIGFLPVT